MSCHKYEFPLAWARLPLLLSVDLVLPGPERDAPDRSGPSSEPGAPDARAPDTLALARDRHIDLGFGALYADPGDARSRLDAVVDLDPAGALRILAESPEAFGALRGPATLGAPLAAVLADARTDRDTGAPGTGGEPTPPDVRLEYDGRFLTLRSAEPDRIERESFRAVSGRPGEDGTFDLSEARQAERGVGPLPEGEYHIHTDEVQQIGAVDRLAGAVGLGNWKGGTTSWGEQRVWVWPGATHTGPPHLHAESVSVPVPGTTTTIERDGFSIHGGSFPGSAGCIDLTQNDAAFFRSLADTRTHTSVVPLVVNYPETPGGPSFR